MGYLPTDHYLRVIYEIKEAHNLHARAAALSEGVQIVDENHRPMQTVNRQLNPSE